MKNGRPAGDAGGTPALSRLAVARGKGVARQSVLRGIYSAVRVWRLRIRPRREEKIQHVHTVGDADRAVIVCVRGFEAWR